MRFVESDAAWSQRVLGREIGGSRTCSSSTTRPTTLTGSGREQDEEDEADVFGEDEEAEDFFDEATVWMDGLDRIHKLRGINFCVDLSATPYFLGRVGQETNRPFPWVVSDFGADGRDRVGAGEDPAARGPRHDGRGDPRVLQHLALDPRRS